MIFPGWRSALWWVAVAILCALIVAIAWRGYLSPAAIIDFANQRLC
jgi:hypothetical protein